MNPNKKSQCRLDMLRYFTLKFVLISLAVLSAFVPTQVCAQAPAWRCAHAGAQLLEGDVNGDGQVDAICHDKYTGEKWVALREGKTLAQRWSDATIGWCRHDFAALHIGDVNGDRRADLICKDPGRVWVDYAGNDFFRGTDFFLDTAWCVGDYAVFAVEDKNGDGRADLVCRKSDGRYDVDFADASGRFAGPDIECLSLNRNEQNRNLDNRHPMNSYVALFMGFGALIMLAGIVLLFHKTGHAINKLEIFGQKLELSTPAVVVFLAGAALFVFPFFVPAMRSSLQLNPSTNSSSETTACSQYK